MTPRYDLSVDFLQRWCPGGPWVLTAISVDKKAIETRTFRDPALVLAWLEKHGDRNVYFSVNPCRYDVSKKPSREDVKELAWLHVDIDPRAGEDLQSEQKRALSLATNPPAGIPKPTVTVFSGGGVQLFWKLAEPKEINGVEALYEDAKRYNQALELAFGADNCHNVDRIMRLPGTINWPDERKRKKGRVPALAEVIEWDDSRVYPLGQFTQAAAVQMEARGFTNPVQVSGNIPRINDVNDLQGVSDLAKVVIVQGTDPDKPDRFPTRSEALFFVACECVRADLDNDTIYAIITDPDFEISASVLDKGRGAEGYAKKQIERARLKAIDPHLMEMNDEYFVVGKPKARVVSFLPSEIDKGREILVSQSFEDLRNHLCNKRVKVGTDAQGNPRYCPLGKWWLEHEKRRTFQSIMYRPDIAGDIIIIKGQQHFNLWRGYGVEPIHKENGWSLLREHVRTVLVNGDAASFDYIVKWLAWTVQHPELVPGVAVVLRGDKGVGKGCLGRAMRRLFGQHGIQITSSEHLTGRFNGHLRDVSFLFADEAIAPDDKQAEARLKGLITEPQLFIEDKGEKAIPAPNHLHILVASNELRPVNATDDERRYAIFEAAATTYDKPYWDALYGQLDDGGYAAMLYDLLYMGLDDWHPRWNVPQTEALQEQKDLHNADPWRDKLQELLGNEKEGKVPSYMLWERLGVSATLDAKAGRKLSQVMRTLGWTWGKDLYFTTLKRQLNGYWRGSKDTANEITLGGTI